MKTPVNVAITGAAGQIGYALAFRVASGQMLGPDQPVNLHLLEITPALGALQGVVMELNDCAFPTLNRIVATDDARTAFKDCHVALLVGARPRGPGMERKDLLLANAQIFSAQGKALDAVADRAVRVLVVGNPANTNALDRHEERPGPGTGEFHRDDAPRSQPRAVTARGEDGHARDEAPPGDDLGQPLLDPVPRSASCDRRRQGCAHAGRRRLVSRAVHPRRAAARCGDHQGARRVLRGVGRLVGDRPRARLGSGHARRRLGEHGRAVGWQLWHPGGRHLTDFR